MGRGRHKDRPSGLGVAGCGHDIGDRQFDFSARPLWPADEKFDLVPSGGVDGKRSPDDVLLVQGPLDAVPAPGFDLELGAVRRARGASERIHPVSEEEANGRRYADSDSDRPSFR